MKRLMFVTIITLVFVTFVLVAFTRLPTLTQLIQRYPTMYVTNVGGCALNFDASPNADVIQWQLYNPDGKLIGEFNSEFTAGMELLGCD